MIRTMLAMFVLWGTLLEAHALTATAQTVCTNSDEYQQAYLTVTGAIDPENYARPGVLYLGVLEGTIERPIASYAWDGARFVAWNGLGMMPPGEVRRGGLGGTINFKDIDVSNFLNNPNYSIWVGYGALSVVGERAVAAKNEGVAAARAKFPDRQIPVISDDQMRLSLVETDMRQNKRYMQVMPQVVCTNGAFGLLRQRN